MSTTETKNACRSLFLNAINHYRFPISNLLIGVAILDRTDETGSTPPLHDEELELGSRYKLRCFRQRMCETGIMTIVAVFRGRYVYRLNLDLLKSISAEEAPVN